MPNKTSLYPEFDIDRGKHVAWYCSFSGQTHINSNLYNIIRHSQEENSANGEQITESETDNYNENEGDAATTGGTDILTEGQPGWMEKLLKKAMKKVKVSLR